MVAVNVNRAKNKFRMLKKNRKKTFKPPTVQNLLINQTHDFESIRSDNDDRGTL